MEDWKDLIWFGLSLMCVAYLISLTGVFGGIAGGVANARASEIATRETLIYNSRWATSSGVIMSGVEVVALCRQAVVSGDDINVAFRGEFVAVAYKLFDATHEEFSYASLIGNVEEDRYYKVYYVKEALNPEIPVADLTTAFSLVKGLFPAVENTTDTWSGLVIWGV